MKNILGRFSYLIGLALILSLAACNDRKEVQTGQFFDDAVITTKVKGEFVKDDELNSLAINVETTQQVVALKGTVKNDEQVHKAISIAERVEGVKSVKNDLVIDGTK